MCLSKVDESRRFMHSFDGLNFRNNLTQANKKTLNNAIRSDEQETHLAIKSTCRFILSENKFTKRKKSGRVNCCQAKFGGAFLVSRSGTLIRKRCNSPAHGASDSHQIQCPNVEKDRPMSIAKINLNEVITNRLHGVLGIQLNVRQMSCIA